MATAGESDWEIEEEIMVLVELPDVLDNELFQKPPEFCKVVGVETNNPVMQLDHCVFKGEYRDTVGTAVLFEEQVVQHTSGKLEKELKYKHKTQKKLCLERIFLTEKNNQILPSQTEHLGTDKSTDSLNSNDQDVTNMPSDVSDNEATSTSGSMLADSNTSIQIGNNRS